MFRVRRNPSWLVGMVTLTFGLLLAAPVLFTPRALLLAAGGLLIAAGLHCTVQNIQQLLIFHRNKVHDDERDYPAGVCNCQHQIQIVQQLSFFARKLAPYKEGK